MSVPLRFPSALFLLALCTLPALGPACASQPDLAVKPGDRCRVAWLRKDGAAVLELVNKTRAENEPGLEQRVAAGPAKIMRDSEMALLIDELGRRGYFEHAATGGPIVGGRSSLCVEINATRWNFPSLITTGGADAAGDYGHCVRVVQDAFNHTWSLKPIEVSTEQSGRDYFDQERQRVEKENQQRVKDAVKRSNDGEHDR